MKDFDSAKCMKHIQIAMANWKPTYKRLLLGNVKSNASKMWHLIQSENIRESVDSLCRDDADMPMTPYIGKAYNRPNAAFVSLFR